MEESAPPQLDLVTIFNEQPPSCNKCAELTISMDEMIAKARYLMNYLDTKDAYLSNQAELEKVGTLGPILYFVFYLGIRLGRYVLT